MSDQKSEEIDDLTKITHNYHSAALRPRSIVNHNNTVTTKKAEELSSECERKTSTILNEIKRIVRDNPQVDLDRLRSVYGARVLDEYAKCNKEIFLATTSFVERFTKRTHSLTPIDLALIDEQTRKSVNAFWTVVRDMISAIQGSKTINAQELRDQRVDRGMQTDFNARLEVISSAGIFGLLGKSTLFLLGEEKRSAPANVPLFVGLERGTIEARITTLKPIEIPEKLLVIWITERDDRVCPICQPLDGLSYDIDDPNTPKPVDDTHPRCRCRLLPIDPATDNVFNG